MIFSCKENSYKNYTYPEITNDSTLITKFGISYTNYFTNLENLESKNLFGWLALQDSISESYFDKNNFQNYLTLLKDDKNGIEQANYWYRTINEEEYFYWMDNDSLQVLYMGNKLKKDKIALSFIMDDYIHFYQPSSDGTKVQIILSKEDGDFLQVIDISNQNVLFETSEGINPNFLSHSVWVGNNNIAYTAFPNADNSKSSYVALSNILTGKTEVIFSGSDIESNNVEDYLIPVISSDKSNNFQIYVGNATEHYSAYNSKIVNREKPTFNFKPLFTNRDSIIYYAKEKKDNFYFLRYKNGKKTYVKSIIDSIEYPSKDKLIFKPKEEEEIASFTLTQNQSYVITTKDGTSSFLYNITPNGENKLMDLNYPISHLSFYQDLLDQPFTIVQSQGWNKNYSFFNINDAQVISDNEKMTRETSEKFNNIINEIIEIESHDGIMVPMTIIKTKDYKPVGNNKAVIYAYGAYGLNIDPIYSEAILEFVSKGNIFAIAHVRGGGEKGLEWYNNGVGDKKYNSWNDLLFCSQYLKNKGYTKQNGLGVLFDSAGGITCGMAINKEPGMFNAVVGISPMFNPIRLANQKSYNAGDNDYDFGTIDNENGFNSLMALDPIVNFSPKNTYPSTLIMTGNNDDLVPICDSSKYIALLQENRIDKSKPYILDVFEGEGHYLSTGETFNKAMFFFNKEL